MDYTLEELEAQMHLANLALIKAQKEDYSQLFGLLEVEEFVKENEATLESLRNNCNTDLSHRAALMESKSIFTEVAGVEGFKDTVKSLFGSLASAFKKLLMLPIIIIRKLLGFFIGMLGSKRSGGGGGSSSAKSLVFNDKIKKIIFYVDKKPEAKEDTGLVKVNKSALIRLARYNKDEAKKLLTVDGDTYVDIVNENVKSINAITDTITPDEVANIGLDSVTNFSIDLIKGELNNEEIEAKFEKDLEAKIKPKADALDMTEHELSSSDPNLHRSKYKMKRTSFVDFEYTSTLNHENLSFFVKQVIDDSFDVDGFIKSIEGTEVKVKADKDFFDEFVKSMKEPIKGYDRLKKSLDKLVAATNEAEETITEAADYLGDLPKKEHFKSDVNFNEVKKAYKEALKITGFKYKMITYFYNVVLNDCVIVLKHLGDADPRMDVAKALSK